MEGGNTSRILVWLDDTVIIKKPLEGRNYYFVADARTGQPIPHADVELFGWRMVRADGKDEPFLPLPAPPTTSPAPGAAGAKDGKNEYCVETVTLALKTDDQGQVQVPAAKLKAPERSYQWLITARTAEGRFAYLGFMNIWSLFGRYDQPRYQVYTITDRPVYRPGASCGSSSGSRCRATISGRFQSSRASPSKSRS